jgi:hypothetical protein
MLDNFWTMTCGYGLRRTDRTHSIDLRIRRPEADGTGRALSDR